MVSCFVSSELRSPDMRSAAVAPAGRQRPSARQVPAARRAPPSPTPLPTPRSMPACPTFRCQPLENTLDALCPWNSAASNPPLGPAQYAALQRAAADFIDSADFHRPDAEAEILGSELLSLCREQTCRAGNVHRLNLPPHLASLCESQLLNPPQERQLFQRMNYLRYRAHQTLQKLADRLRISKERVRQIEKRAMQKLSCMAQDQPLSVRELEG